MNFYIYSITYLDDDFASKREEGIMAASSYADAMAEINGWDLSVEEARLREICGVYQELDCERPWISIGDLKEAFKEAGLQLSNKSACKCKCGEGEEGLAPLDKESL